MKQYIEIKCRHCGAEDLVKTASVKTELIGIAAINTERAFNMNILIMHGKPA
jgi:uncharacterized radical SAM superfamily protein